MVPLTDAERAALRASHINSLYWQAGELELQGGALVFRRTALLPLGSLPVKSDQDLQILPVVRVSTAIRSPEQFTGEALGGALKPLVDASPGREIQLDFDCPDRLLPIYAERLQTARRIADIHRLTITALAGWADAPARASLWPAVDAVFPMLYDVETDPVPGTNTGSGAPSPCQPRPLLDPAELSARLRGWSRCPIPWYAGLPVFSRVTLYDAAGLSKGHLRSWDWEDIVFNTALALDRPPNAGTTVLRAARPTRIGEHPVPVGGFVAVRGVERAALRSAIAEAGAAGARGVVLFRLPDPPSPERPSGGSWSLPQLLALLSPSPPAEARLTLNRAADGTDRWVLRNDSDFDLPPRFVAPARGYGMEMEIAGGAPGWREALAGDFHHVAAHVFVHSTATASTASDKPVAVAIPLARRLTFWFAALPAHASLTTGLVQLAPGVDPASVRFRLPSANQPEATPWQSAD